MLIAQLSDLHVRLPGTRAYGVVETNPFVERAFKAVMALDPTPEAIILSGDLADCGLKEEYDLLADMIRARLTVPVYVIPGNHDHRERLKAGLAHLPGVATDPTFVQYVVDDLPVRLVMLDSLVPEESHGDLCPARLAFLEQALAAAPDRPTLVVLHHPPILTGIAHMDKVNLRAATAMEAVIRKHPQVERVLCGHVHRSIIARFGGSLVQTSPSVAHQVSFDLRPDGDATFTMEPPAYLLHDWRPDRGLTSHQLYVETYAGPYPFDSAPEPDAA